ncbi:MAG TPA: peptidyl-prolyl cis-trans isomerase [Candidatus Hydrogenedentes bacterium]|jgi:hypothetical protein|nr:peptidyl-prolyl cis-trans isomerase [Candidatus Hydrogenedentota bacterium]
MSKYLRLLQDPFVLFLLIGASIFGVYNFSRTAEQSRMDDRISIDGPTQDWIYGNFTKQFRRPPTRDEMSALVKAYIVAEVKYRHALDMGLDDRDSIIRRRMMQKFDFLFGNGAADLLPEDSVLEEWYLANPDEFLEPDRVSFTHVYFSPDKRESAGSDAASMLDSLGENSTPEGDLFPFEVRFEKASSAEVRNVLGPEFARDIFLAPMKTWSGPIQSGLGFHLIQVTEKIESKLLPLEEIRDAVLERWRETESKRILEKLISELTDQFEIEIDEESLMRFEYTPDESAVVQ